MFGHLPVVKQLLTAGSNLTMKNQDGLTPLQVAKQQKFITVVEYLSEREKAIQNSTKQNICAKLDYK